MKLLSNRPDIEHAETLGQLLQVFLVSIQRSDYEHILQRHGITEFEPAEWYPLKLILEIFEEIERNPNAMQNLVSIGVKVTEVIDMKGRCPTFHDMMETLPLMEKEELHHNNPGQFEVRQIDKKCYEVVDRTVWPHDLEYGVLYGIARLYNNENRYKVARVAIEVDPQTGDEIGIYHITW